MVTAIRLSRSWPFLVFSPQTSSQRQVFPLPPLWFSERLCCGMKVREQLNCFPGFKWLSCRHACHDARTWLAILVLAQQSLPACVLTRFPKHVAWPHFLFHAHFPFYPFSSTIPKVHVFSLVSAGAHQHLGIILRICIIKSVSKEQTPTSDSI